VWDVRIDDCSFPASRADMIAGLDWVAINAIRPAVANLSYSMLEWIDGVLPGSVHHAAVQLRNSGVFLTVSAGNHTSRACDFSPANAAELMTVGATNTTDAKASFSNYGTCVDIYAPGENVPTATPGGSHAYKSGTTYSAPMTAGVAALYLAKYPLDDASKVHYAIIHGATTGVVGFPTELLLYSRLPAPVRVAIEGPVVVPPGAVCNWTSVVRAGRGPFIRSWTGAVSSSSSAVSGSLSSSGYVAVQVWDALGGTAYDMINVTVDPSLSGMLICP
jgi:subtilisin family serine protease